MPMSFAAAAEQMKGGKAVTRPGMIGDAAVYRVTRLTVNGTESAEVPFYALRMATPGVIPWTPTQADLHAEDWSVVG